MKKIKPNEEFQLADTIFTYSLNNGSIELKKVRKEKDSVRESKRFVAPSLADVKAYCEERKNDVNPQQWHDFYESKGWMVGKNKMVNWKAAVRTWEKKEISHSGGAEFTM